MRIEAHDKFGETLVMNVTRVVIYNDYNLPVAVAFKQDKGWLYVGHCRDPEFFDILKSMGINSEYIVDTLEPKDLKLIKPER